MAPYDLPNIASGNALLPEATKPLPEPMLAKHQWGLVASTQGQFNWKCSRFLSLYIYIYVWKLLIHNITWTNIG